MKSSGLFIQRLLLPLLQCLVVLGLFIQILFDPFLLRALCFFLQGDLQALIRCLLGLFLQLQDHHLIVIQLQRKAFIVSSPEFQYLVCVSEDCGSRLLSGFLLPVHCRLSTLPEAFCLSKSSGSEEDEDSSPHLVLDALSSLSTL